MSTAEALSLLKNRRRHPAAREGMGWFTQEEKPVEVVGYDAPKFDPDDPELYAYLEEHGYAVVRGVADEATRLTAEDEFWDFMESLGGEIGEPVFRDQPRTWGPDFLPHGATGIITGCGFGQSRFCWRLRTLPAVRQVFESIWETDDLVTSFDGGNAFRPWEGRPSWKTQGGWWQCASHPAPHTPLECARPRTGGGRRVGCVLYRSVQRPVQPAARATARLTHRLHR